MQFRTADPSDLDALWALRTRAATVQCADHYSTEDLETWLAAAPSDRFHVHIERGHAIIGTVDQRMVGYAVIDVEEQELEALFVTPEQFRQGFGSRLLIRAEEMAQQESIDTLGLSAALNAIDFYRANGYELLAINDFAHRSGVMLKRGVMRKRLA